MPDVDMTAPADDALPLVGTLTLPAGPGPHPAVLLLPGSGRLDRNANTARLRMELGPTLAAALAENGIASLRYDRRGVCSTGGDWRATGFADNRNDAAAALRALAARSDIRADAGGVVGHSEGAVHAMSLAAHHQVRAAVLLAGFTRGGEDALLWQAGMLTRALPRFVRSPLRRLAARQLTKVKATTTDVARVAGKRVNAKWLRELLHHDPRQDLAHIRVPVLAITGEKDIQVDPADLDAIRELVPGAETHRIPDLTHVLRKDPGRPSVRSYPRLLRQPVDADLLAQVAGWLATRLQDTHAAS